MNPINILTTAIDSLWWWTYGIIAGWGLTFTIVVAALIVLLIRTVNLQRRLDRLEARVISDEREYNLILKSWPGKKQ
jgi:uncharacterized membrane protein YhiD involved in acid resistance